MGASRSSGTRRRERYQPCIYCSLSATGREHWIPRALGRFVGYEPLQNRVCRDCDRRLGHELDDEFAHSGTTALFRRMVGIRGRDSHKETSPFFRRAQTSPANVATTKDGTLLEIDENLVARPLRHIVVEDVTGARHRIPFPPEATVEWLRAAVRSRDIRSPQLREIHVATLAEGDEAAALLSRVFPKFEATVFGPDGPKTVERVQTVSAITGRYLRAIAKIALHFALKSMPELSGHEREFEAVKRYIADGVGDDQEFVELADRQVLWQAQRGWTPSSWCHLMGVAVDDGYMRVRLQFFLGPLGPPPVWTVVLGKDPFRVLAPRHRGILAVYFATSQERKHHGHDGFIKELSGGRQTIWTPPG